MINNQNNPKNKKQIEVKVFGGVNNKNKPKKKSIEIISNKNNLSKNFLSKDNNNFKDNKSKIINIISNNISINTNNKIIIQNSSNNNNKNEISDCKIIRHIPEKDDNLEYSIENVSNEMDKSEINTIKNIILIYFGFYKENNLSRIVCDEIKKELGGEWFVLVSDKNDKISLKISTIAQKGFLVIAYGNTRFQIARIK